MRFNELLESNDDYEIRNLEKLDRILVKLCEMVIEGQQEDSVVAGQRLKPGRRTEPQNFMRTPTDTP